MSAHAFPCVEIVVYHKHQSLLAHFVIRHSSPLRQWNSNCKQRAIRKFIEEWERLALYGRASKRKWQEKPALHFDCMTDYPPNAVFWNERQSPATESKRRTGRPDGRPTLTIACSLIDERKLVAARTRRHWRLYPRRMRHGVRNLSLASSGQKVHLLGALWCAFVGGRDCVTPMLHTRSRRASGITGFTK